MPLSPLMTEAAIRNADEEAVYDRSYRIRYNKGQVINYFIHKFLI